MAADTTRFIDVTPLGVRDGLTQDTAAVETRLLQAFLARTPTRPWTNGELTELVPDERAVAARALFRLQRENWIAVRLDPPDDDARAWPAVAEDLALLAEGLAGPAVLLDADGLVLAHGGPWSSDHPDDPLLAAAACAGDTCRVPIAGADQAATLRMELVLPSATAAERPALVRLARRLRRACDSQRALSS